MSRSIKLTGEKNKNQEGLIEFSQCKTNKLEWKKQIKIKTEEKRTQIKSNELKTNNNQIL